jgi:hypothetical protein
MRLIRYSWSDYVQQSLPSSESLFNSIFFISSIAEAYQKSICVYTIYNDDKPLFSLPVLYTNRDAKLPTHFFYQAIIPYVAMSERIFINAWELLILELKKDFDAIDLKLAPYAEDIRPFTWAGFGHKIYYTASIDLGEDPNYSENIRRSIKKAIKSGLSVRIPTYSEKITDAQLHDMQKNGLGAQELSKVRYWMKELAGQSALVQFELLDAEQNNIGSSIYLYDAKQAYLIGVMGGTEESGGQAYLYDQAFAYFKSKGIQYIDLLGANIPSIAIYKSKLGAEAKQYSMVSYRKYKLLAFTEQFVKRSIKAVLKSFRIINK